MPLVFDGINRADDKMSESSSTASNNNQSKSLATVNHHNTMTSTDIVATTTTKRSNKSTRQYKSKNNNKDIIAGICEDSTKSKSAALSSTNTTNCNTTATSSSSASSMASSNRRQSIHRSVKSTKQPSTTLVLSTAASTSNTKSNITTSTLQTSTTIPSNQQQEEYQENDTFLSLSNPTYKSVLYTHFQQMNNNDTREEEKRVANKIINIFKKNGGRFYKKSGRGNVQKEMNFVQVDEDAALKKIQDDIRRRRENAQHWQHQQTLTAPPEEADIPSSPSISTSQTKTDKKKKSSKKSISIVRREGAKLGWESRRKKSEQSNVGDDEEDGDGSSMSNSSSDKEDRSTRKSSDSSVNMNDDTTAEMSSEVKKKSSAAIVVKKEIKKRESKARTVKLTHPHASSDIKAQSSPTSTSSASAVVKEKKKSKTPVKKTKKSAKPRAGKSQQKTTTIRAARPSEKEQADAQQVTKSNGMTEWQCPKCSKKFAWKSPQCAGACISNHMRKSHGITLPTMKELSQKKKDKKSVVVKSPARRVVGGASRPSRNSTSVSTSAPSSSLSGANQQPKQQHKTRKRGREPSAKKASVTFDSDIQSYLGEESVKKKKRKSDSTTSSSGGLKKMSVKGNTPPSQAVVSKSKRAASSRRQSAKTTKHVTPTSMQKTKSPKEPTSLVVIESANSSSKKSGTNNKLNFAQKLHAMINDANENHPDTLCWNEDGDSFIVKERDTPLQPLLSRYFRTAKYTSLYRSLANYGFVADYVKIQEKDVVCFMREDFTRDSAPTELSCFTKDKSTTAEKIASVKEEEAATLSMPAVSNHDKSCTSADSRRSVPKRKAFTNACGVIQGAMTEEEVDESPTKEEEEEGVDAFEVGQRIEARYRGQGRRWYKGTVVASLGNGLYDIDYDDGDSDRSLSSDAIRVRMPRRKKIPKQKQQKKQSRIGEDDDMMMIDTSNNDTQQQSAPLLNERQRIIFDLGSGRKDENDDSFDKENTSKAGVGLFSPIKAKRVTFATVPSTSIEEEERVVDQEKAKEEAANDSSFSPIKSFNQVKSKGIYSRPPTSLDTSSLAKSTNQTLSSPTQVIISSKSQAVKEEQVQPFVLVKVGVIDNEVVMPPSKDDDDTSLHENTTDTFQGLLSPESDSNTPSSKDPGDDLFQFNWDGRASSSDDFLADEIGYDLFSTNRMSTSSSYSSRRGTYASGGGTVYSSYPVSGHGKARTSSSWDKIRI